MMEVRSAHCTLFINTKKEKMKKALFYMLITTVVLALSCSTNAQAADPANVKHPEEPVTSMTLSEVSDQDIDQFMAAWNTNWQSLAQMPGCINATLYKSIAPDHPYRLITVVQWQSYKAWLDAHTSKAYRDLQQENSHGNTPDRKSIQGFYRPAASYYTFGDKQAGKNEAKLERVKKDPAISQAEVPFVFINLMEMAPQDISPFIADWKSRSQLTRQQLGSMTATLYKTILPDSRYQIVNISQWQSYDAFVNGQNDPSYSARLEADLNQTASIKLTRGFFRPVAYCAHLYD